jgi:DNA repair protein RecN (Recombination protein N)
MLRFLAVRHLAVIDQMEVDFEPGFNVITGETGAGKSILVDAIGLLIGGRASADLVRTGEDLATIQAIFETPDGAERIVRREISREGRSRAFIDDTLATAAALRELGAALVGLHGQHEHQALFDPAAQLAALDAYDGDPVLLATVRELFDQWRQAAHALDRTRLDDREKQARIDIATFQLQEIDKAAPAAGEDERLAAERTILANADRLSRLAGEAYAALYDDEHAALGSLTTVWKRVEELAAIDPRFEPHRDARVAVKSQLEDLAYVLRGYTTSLDASPARLQHVEDRLALLERLKRKFGPSLEEVLSRRRALGEELAALGASEARIAALEEEELAAREHFLDAATRLSGVRRDAALRLARALERTLADLALPKCRMDLRLRTADRPEDWSSSGLDTLEFYCSPNPGEDLRPLARIASGGELSRIMLALKTLASSDRPGRTLIFDEVDAGIGGAAATAVGARLRTLGARDQVIGVTHLPQVAAQADAHFQVTKQVQAGRTTTVLTRLDRAGRELEIARMIAGAAVTPAVLSSARDLLDAKGESESEAMAKPLSTPRRAKGRSRGA